MTSVVDTSVKHFHSAMVGAPILNGQAGSMIALLNACLKDGFDVKSATSLTVDSGVATLAFTGSHSATVESVVLVAGSSVADLNGEQKITAIGGGFVKFATAAADGAATGSISFKMAPAGWEKTFTGTNLAVYRSLDVLGTRMYVRVDDTGTTICRLRGYEQMTDISMGAGMFPLDSQINGGGYLNKSNAANSTPVKWKIIADSRGMYVNIVGASSGNPLIEAGRTTYVGDFIASRPGGDPYAFVIGCGITGANTEAPGTCDQNAGFSQYAPRAYHGLGSSVAHAALPETGTSAISGADPFLGAFPSKIDGSMRLSRRYIAEGTTSESRGVLPGLYTIPQSGVGTAIAPGTIQPGTGVLAGRKLLALGCGASSSTYPSVSLGISMVDITGPWAR